MPIPDLQFLQAWAVTGDMLSSAPPTSFLGHYEALVASGAIEPDAAQREVAEAFGDLEQRLSHYKPPRKQGLFGRLFADKDSAPPRGLYVHGDVGRGKTMLMDLFFQACSVEHKRRAHFHEFMAEVHERIYGFRQEIAHGKIPDEDVIGLTANAIFEQAWLLCFDEFHVTDIADAMILGRLFARLFELGTVVVATSNVAPDDLYKGGLNRSLFLPFIAQITDHMTVLRLDARTDFRLEKLAGVEKWLGAAENTATAAGGQGPHDRQCALPAAGYFAQGPNPACAVLGAWRGAVWLRRYLRAAARCIRLPQACPRLSPPHDRSHSGDGLSRAERRQTLHHLDRYAVRQWREADGLGRGRSVVALRRLGRRRGERIQADVVAVDRDGLGILLGPAAWLQGFGGQRFDDGVGRDLTLVRRFRSPWFVPRAGHAD